LTLLDFPLKYLDCAVEAIQRDSQNGTFGKRGQGNWQKQLEEHKELWKVLDREMELAGLPLRHTDTFDEFKQKLLKYEML